MISIWDTESLLENLPFAFIIVAYIPVLGQSGIVLDEAVVDICDVVDKDGSTHAGSPQCRQ